MDQFKRIPKNIGVIMDGNGRWATLRDLPRYFGHTKGMLNMLHMIVDIFELGAENVACYSLSTENLNRDKEEVSHILNLVLKYFDKFVEVCKEHKICAKMVGNLDLFPEDVKNSLLKTESILSEFEGMGRTVYIAVAYGSRNEIISAVNAAIKKGDEVTEESFLKSLYLPMDLDLIIRTGKEKRLSNFFLYQASYAEIYFSDKYYPDFNKEDLEEIFDWYSKRKRNYGLVGE